MNKEFQELAEKVNAERRRDELWEKHSMKKKASYEITLFEIWGRINNKSAKTYVDFLKYLKTEKQKMDFWTRMYISKHYFNKNIVYNENDKKWEMLSGKKKMVAR